MLSCVPIHAEGPRYATSLVFVPGLWMRPTAFRGLAGFLGHRGWEGLVADLSGHGGGLEARVASVGEVVRQRSSPPVLVGHDVGGLIARRVAEAEAVRAIVWLAPMVPGDGTLARLVRPWRAAAAALLGHGVPRPRGQASLQLFGRPGSADLDDREHGRLLLDALRPGTLGEGPGVPQAVVMGAGDSVAALVGPTAGERLVLPGAGRWLLGGAVWLQCAGLVHRWLVTHLGAELLEFYDEAMAEREQEEDG